MIDFFYFCVFLLYRQEIFQIVKLSLIDSSYFINFGKNISGDTIHSRVNVNKVKLSNKKAFAHSTHRMPKLLF